MRASLINPINGIFHNNFYCSTKGVEGTYRIYRANQVPNCLVLTPKHTAAFTSAFGSDSSASNAHRFQLQLQEPARSVAPDEEECCTLLKEIVGGVGGEE